MKNSCECYHFAAEVFLLIVSNYCSAYYADTNVHTFKRNYVLCQITTSLSRLLSNFYITYHSISALTFIQMTYLAWYTHALKFRIHLILQEKVAKLYARILVARSAELFRGLWSACSRLDM